jgi:hypothetical protein
VPPSAGEHGVQQQSCVDDRGGEAGLLAEPTGASGWCGGWFGWYG